MAGRRGVRERSILFSGPMVRAILKGRKSQTRRLITPGTAWFGSASRQFWEHANFSQAWVDGHSSEPCGFSEGGQYLHVPCHSQEDGFVACPGCREWGWDSTSHRLYPRVAPGDRLWVRETFYCDDYRYPCGPMEDLKAALYYRKDAGIEGGSKYGDNCWTGFSLETMRVPWRPSIHMPRWASRLTLEVTGVRGERLQEISVGDCLAEGMEPCLKPGVDIDIDGEFWPQGERTIRHQFSQFWDSINGKGSWDSNPWVWVIEFKRAEVSHG